MNNKITNPFLKQMLTEIASNTGKGRMTDINWAVLNEAKKKKTLKKEVAKRPPQEDPTIGGEDENPAQPSQEVPPEAAPDAGNQIPPGGDAGGDAGLPDLGTEPGTEDPLSDTPSDMPPSEPSVEDPEQAQADAEKAKADVEQAKAEKDQAEKELEDQSYIKLNSQSGTQFLLSKLLDHAFKTNTTDALAGEMVGKLKIDTPEDMSAFVEELAPFMVIPGMAQLVSSMKGLATKQNPAEEEPEDAGSDMGSDMGGDTESLQEVERSLPTNLSGTTPRFNYGPKAFIPIFASDVEKSLFIVSQKTPSRMDHEFRKFLNDCGYTDQEIAQHGQSVRQAIKTKAATANPGNLIIDFRAPEPTSARM